MNFSQDTAAGRESEALGEALDRMWEAVAMLSAEGKVVYANRAAAQILHRGAGLALGPDGRLITANLAAKRVLARVLTDQGAEQPVAIPRAGEAPLILNAQALPPPLKGAFGAVALIFISDPAAKLADRSAAMRSAFGLTNAEARTLQLISEGASLKQIAGANRVSYETVRTHVRRILGKTGAHRQADLVRLTHALR